ncbi:precorrin-2 dehydrogenase/sirohydrochlorin ferrochelatase family protein [Mucispirillum schaedleri]|uniref:precorrin-2 dehydrogenase/sirohydrochlorin ferrochelatase family protein n=1 Tax=Mucispirillum schaedleri TaxID=248039 RepID=UPI001F5AC6A6|nr:NAD(P)-dependent oxidoreductase [Mucispirillum schaedleri]
MAYFPIFINVENVKVLVIGLGCIAARRINVLKNFGAEITVITKEVKTNVENIDIKIKEFEEDDIKEIYDIVIAATDNNAVNKNIIKLAKEKNIKYYNSISDKNDNNFFFPAVIENDEIVCGLISKNGLNHKIAKKYADILRNTLCIEKKAE